MEILLDLYCGPGGAAKGYQRAGFYVIGVDIQPQLHYCGDLFYQADARKVLIRLLRGHDVLGCRLSDIAMIHASPECQGYSKTRFIPGPKNMSYRRQIASLRRLLKMTGKVYAIENVPQAPLRNPLTLCGTMFGLRVFRHRAFETWPEIYFPPASCNHWGIAKHHKLGETNHGQYPFVTVAGHQYTMAVGAPAMGIDWMTSREELNKSIPPAYTEFIGRQMLSYIQKKKGLK